jgi:transposase
VVKFVAQSGDHFSPGGVAWLSGLLNRKPTRLVTVALANKMARIAWAVLCRGEIYRAVAAPAAI